MKIKKLTTINWANLEDKEYSLDDIVFITGETGVGKSTFLDAIQTVLTAAYHNIVNYNAGQDESEKKSRQKEYRKLEGYVLGEDRGEFSRPSGAVCTIVLTFMPSKNETSHTFNAIINIKASLEEQASKRKAVLEGVNFLIVKECEINKINLLDGNKVLYGNDLRENLMKTLKLKKENILSIQEKKDYLTLLYGNIWGIGRTGIEQAKKAAKAFANFIYARPVNNLNSFIRTEFLEEKRMNDEVEGLSKALRSLKEVKEESKAIEDGMIELNEFSTAIENILSLWQKNIEEHYLFALNEYKKNKSFKEEVNKNIEKNKKNIDELTDKNIQNSKKIETIKKRLEPLLIKRDGNDTYRKIEDIQKKIDEQIKSINEIKRLLRGVSGNVKNTLYRDISKLSKDELKVSASDKILDILDELNKFEKLNLNEILPYDISVKNHIDTEDFKMSYDAVFSHLSKIEKLFKEFLNSEEYKKEHDNYEKLFYELQQNKKTTKNNIDELEQNIKKMEQNQIVCPEYIMKDFDMLQSYLGSTNASMLYQHIDFLEDQREWAKSIEGFLKNNRFAVIVPIGYEIKAINIVKKYKLKSIKIIQSEKMLNDTKHISANDIKTNSIINKLNIDNEIAKAYLVKNYRNVLCFNDEIELKNGERGLTKNFKAVNGGLMFYCEAKELFFGDKAFQERLNGFKTKFSEEKNKYNEIEIQIPKIRATKDILLSLYKFELNIAQMKEDFYKYYDKYLINKDIINSLNTDDFEKLKNSIENLKIKKEKLEKNTKNNDGKIYHLNESRKDLDSNLTSVIETLKKLEANLESKKETLDNILNLCKLPNEVDLKEVAKKPESIKDVIFEEWNKFQKVYVNSKVFEQKEISYNENPDVIAHDYSFDFDGFEKLYNEKNIILTESERLSNTLQIKYKKQIEDSEKEVERVFVDHYCIAMHRNISASKREIKHFSNKLSNHKFEDDRFELIIKEADPEYKEYKNLFAQIAENQNLFALANNEELQRTKDKLLGKFLDISKEGKDLFRISDYRNYANYDIIQNNGQGREISLSKNGKNSGGQGETSYYVIRSINLHSALNPLMNKKSTLETALIDESFVKTNDLRAKEIIKYLNETLGFQVIMALPTKSSNELLRMNCSNYHITKLSSNQRGELNYETWVKYTNNDAVKINEIINSELPSLFNSAKIEGQKEYNERV